MSFHCIVKCKVYVNLLHCKVLGLCQFIVLKTVRFMSIYCIVNVRVMKCLSYFTLETLCGVWVKLSTNTCLRISRHGSTWQGTSISKMI